VREDSLPQYAGLELPFGCEMPIVHCPICGRATIEVDQDVGKVTPCPHLAFIYIGEVGDFEYQSEECQRKFQELDIDDLSFENFKDVLKTAGYGNKLLALELTYGGMGCGPVWYTNVFGFDYSTLGDKKSP
jgi:hypothetical protein